jgi:hypothetical protein
VHVSAPDRHLPVARGAALDSYWHQSPPEARAITRCLYGFLSAHQLKKFRTKRRRIRAHFGSPDNIMSAALTIGQRRTAQGTVGGYMLKIDARHGIKGLFPASESYFLDRTGNEPCTSNNLSRISMSGIPGCLAARNTNLTGCSPKRWRSCPTFFDRASEKLSQLARFNSNELLSADLQSMAAALSSNS